MAELLTEEEIAPSNTSRKREAAPILCGRLCPISPILKVGRRLRPESPCRDILDRLLATCGGERLADARSGFASRRLRRGRPPPLGSGISPRRGPDREHARS